MAQSIRAAVADDATAIAAIWHRGWCDAHLGHVSEELVAARTEASFGVRAQQRIADTSVATVDGEIAGFVMVVADEVEQVYVSTRHQGTGIAAVLLAEAERVVRTNGFERAWLAVVIANARARKFYERHGWIDDGAFDYAAAGPSGSISVPCQRYIRALG